MDSKDCVSIILMGFQMGNAWNIMKMANYGNIITIWMVITMENNVNIRKTAKYKNIIIINKGQSMDNSWSTTIMDS